MRLQNRSIPRVHGRLLFVFAAAIGCFLSHSTASADTGLLFRFRDSSTLSAGVVITPDPRLRFEPEIAFAFSRATFEEEFTFNDNTSSSTTFELGIGAIYVLQHQGPFGAHFGPRAGYSRAQTSADFSSSFERKTAANGWFASWVVGGEVDVSSRVNLGVEGAIVYESASGTSTGTSSAGEADFSSSRTSTRFSLVLLWYPWGEK